jgi:molecular chaperone DnaK
VTGVRDEPILAIDFGTRYSTAYLVPPHSGDLVSVSEPYRGDRWPSAVLAGGGDGRLQVGSPAYEQRKDAAENCFASEFKRDLGLPDPIVAGYTRADLLRHLFEAMAARARSELDRYWPGQRVQLGRTVLTVPASYRDPVSYGPPWTLRGLMVSAAEAAGLGPVELLPEPVAAAWGLRHRFSPESCYRVLIYDFGGGTFDTALIQIGPGDEWHELGTGSELVGGMDIDRTLANLLKQKSSQWVTDIIRPGSTGDSERRYKVDVAAQAEAENQKIQLATTEQAQTLAQLLDGPRVSLTLAELNEAAEPYIRETITCYRRMLARAEEKYDITEVEDLNAVLLVGGTTKLPLVRKLVEADLRAGIPAGTGPEIGNFGLDVDRAVAHGAAMWACDPGNEIELLKPLANRPGRSMLRWQFAERAQADGRSPSLMRWHTGPGQPYGPLTPLARIRYPDGSLWDLAAREAGSLSQLLTEPDETAEAADNGVPVKSRQWLATAERVSTREVGGRVRS